mgnify:CR=1 FL=1
MALSELYFGFLELTSFSCYTNEKIGLDIGAGVSAP